MSIRCPFCNKDLSSYERSLVEKHIAKCRSLLKPKYIYSDRKRGRPSNKEKKILMEEREKNCK